MNHVRISLGLDASKSVRIVTHRVDVASQVEPHSLRSEQDLQPGERIELPLHPGSCITVFECEAA